MIGGYEKEQMDKFSRGFPHHWGCLDHINQQILLSMIMERYGEDAQCSHDTLYEELK